jgi:hypothetical protein
MTESMLHALADMLRPALSSVEMRGDGASCFLYLTGNGRSAEVSRNADGFWVEFWDSLDASALPAKEATFDSIQAIEIALRIHFR